MNIDDPGVIKAVGALGGGVASTGRTCGCLTGGVCAISRMFGKSSPEGREDAAMWRLSYKLSKHFEDLTADSGGVDCADIAKINWSNRGQVKEFYGQPTSRRLTVCAPLVGDTALALGELLEAHQAKAK